MLTRELRALLARERRAGLLWSPSRGLRFVQTVPAGLDSWLGERPDGALELVRRAANDPAIELLLNELEVSRSVRHRGLPVLEWAARTRHGELHCGYRWRPARELVYPLDLRWLLRSFAALARALGALHEAGWVHGDVKPEAVWWSEDPDETWLWDHRFAQRPGPRRFEAFTARYAAPEQVTGGEVGPAADVHALGVSLYSLFIRRRFPSIVVPAQDRPGAGEGPEAPLSAITCMGETGDASGGDSAQGTIGAKVLFAVELERVVRRSTDIAVARELLRLVERATAHDPAERFADGAAFAAAVAELLALAEELAG